MENSVLQRQAVATRAKTSKLKFIIAGLFIAGAMACARHAEFYKFGDVLSHRA